MSATIVATVQATDGANWAVALALLAWALDAATGSPKRGSSGKGKGRR